MRTFITLLVVAGLCAATSARLNAQPIEELQRSLRILPPGAAAAQTLDLTEALRFLHIPSVGVALIEDGKLSWSRTFGTTATDRLYQAASLSKLVSAAAALRLVERGMLDLDRNVNDDLTDWRVPENDLTRGHPVTLRGLLSMTAGIGVPGYPGYAPGAPLPNLSQILNGTPPANSPPVRVEAVPGSRYAYSGGGYEIVQALIESKTKARYQDAMRKPAVAAGRHAEQLLSAAALTGNCCPCRDRSLRSRAQSCPAAGALYRSLPPEASGRPTTDLANLLVALLRAYRGAPNAILTTAMAHTMMTRQNGGPYGLGGAVDGSGKSLVLMKRGQNIGYQSYMLVFPETGQGIVVLTGSDNGTTLATALIRRAAEIYRWPPLGALAD